MDLASFDQMSDFKGKFSFSDLYTLEELAQGETLIHRLHPAAKLLVTLLFLLTVLSFPQSAAGALIPYFLYPVILLNLAELPLRFLIRRTAVSLPFCAAIGLCNLFSARQPVLRLGALVLTDGMMLTASLFLKTILCVSAVMLLISATPLPQISAQLRALHVPELFVSLLEMIYRYLSVLAGEANAMLTDYRLRGNGAQWPDIRYAGSLIGNLLLRSADRAERIYQAMLCRGYPMGRRALSKCPWRFRDSLFVLICASACILFRLTDPVSALGSVFL